MKKITFAIMIMMVLCCFGESGSAESADNILDTITPEIELAVSVAGNHYIPADTLEIIFSVTDDHPVVAPVEGIVIDFYADGELLADQSVCIAADPQGNGSYNWIIPQIFSEDIYFIISATDLYGNTGEYQSSVFSAGYELIYGDIDNNGEIDSYDASLILMYIVDLDPIPEDPRPWEDWRILRADVNLDGNIYAYDAALILEYVVQLIPQLPVEE